ncbi:MAG: hypothetical protein IPM51_04275 [Sphingobacteriaceae bacterium]|nr:hypothetical protein [Sphingobacteriaceae bacterium]
MINTYAKIDELFGAPLTSVPKPNVPFKIKGWHLIAGGAVAGLAIYGAYCLHDKYFGDDENIPNQNKSDKNQESSNIKQDHFDDYIRKQERRR